MLEAHDAGNFTASELFYAALRKEGLISSALNMRTASVQELSYRLQTPKEAPDEVHLLTEALSRDWQSVFPDDVRGEVVERTNVFGTCVCRVQWVWSNLQRQTRLIPWTHSNLSYRQDLDCYQGLSERGIEYISSDGREWVVFTLGGTRPWLKGLIRPLAFIYFGLITGDDRWLAFNDKFAEPLKVRYTPRLLRESAEAQRLRDRDDRLRGGDVVLCPRDRDGEGYDFRYEQLDGQGYKTLESQLQRFDERAAIVILGHNLLQRVQGGSLAAMKAAMSLLRTKAVADAKIIMAGFEPVSRVWARANFGIDPSDFPELGGRLVESVSWSLCYDLTDPDAKQASAVRAAQFAQAFSTFAKAAGPKLMELPIDWVEAAERAGIPMLAGEDAYSPDGDDEAELSAEEWLEPPQHMKRAAQRSLEWVHRLGRGGSGAGREMARRIVRGRLSRADVLAIARYWPHHEHDKDSPNWSNLARPSSARIAWGLWGDSGNGRGRAWSERKAEEIRGQMTAPEADTFHKRVLLPAADTPAAGPATARAPGFGPVGRSKRVKDLVGIVSVAVFDVHGRILMGRRADNARWTTPGGHLEPGEAPLDGAVRELWEESGISVSDLRYLGSGSTGTGYIVHAFRADSVSVEPVSHNDPDAEITDWRWVEVPLPDDVRGSLHAPKNVTLALCGLGPQAGLALVRPE
jgi:8-oxo-dGTP pyrophosphatase MutT (NUDIX family)